jgi:EAL domain-containing protein (putative c-di-GMP-specific phosphodiesterase class I)/FixJ family two-component response regulator
MKAQLMFKVFIVDDEPDFAEFVCDVIEDLGHSASIATSADQFCAKYSSSMQIIFIDLFMPSMDGIEILRFLAENNSRASVVLMSGRDASVLHAAREIAEERKIPVLGMLEKPIALESIQRIIEEFKPQAKIAPQKDFEVSLLQVQRAIENQEFFLEFQPQIELVERKPIGAEALIRWRHPDFGVIPPAAFLPLVEKSHLIGPLTQYVMEKACAGFSSLRNAGLLQRISINLSPNTILDIDLPEKLERYFKTRAVWPENVTLEVTETAAMKDLAASIDILARLRMKGFRLAIDDFGTGYSSMEQLVRVPFSELKIDRRFVRNHEESNENRSVSEVSVLLGHKLNMSVLAEGIEDGVILDAMSAMGCNEGQGYGIARPLPLNDLFDWLTEYKVV